MTTATIPLPVDLVRDLTSDRPGAANRVAAFVRAFADLRDGRHVTAEHLAERYQLGRNAAYATLTQARREFAGSSPGVRREFAGSSDDARSSTIHDSAGVRRESAGSLSGVAREPASPPGVRREFAGSRDDARTPKTPKSAGVNREPTGSDDRSIDPPLSLNEKQEGELIDHAPPPTTPEPAAEQAALFEPPTSAEGRRFVAVLRRWSSAPTAAPLRWRVDIAADLAWFNEEVLADPDLVALDLIDALTRWNDWLETQHREKAAGRSGKFPKNWKTSLRNALRFQRENRRPPTPRTGADHDRNAPRGAFDGATQRFDVPIVTGSADDGHLDGWDDV